MVDGDICDARKPLPMQPSLAVFEYTPEDATAGAANPYQVSYLKITCSIASYGATNLERLRAGKVLVTSPFNRDFTGASKQSARQVDDFDSTQRITGADLPCFGALIEVSVGPTDREAWSLSDFPYFSDFEPKKRELFELVTDTGEVASRSLEGTGVLHGGTTSSSNEVFDKTTVGAKVSGQYGSKDSNIKAEGSYGYEEGSSNVDTFKYTNVRTFDAAREARETYSHTTQLSQMYQLLASFHLGTNRAVFFVEPRPHIVQRDRTLIDGPRQLEGIQEFFMVVVRPRGMDICVNASLETLHIGSVIRKDVEESPNTKTATLEFPRMGWDGSWSDPDDDRSYPSENTYTYPAESGWVIDRSKGIDGYDIVFLDEAGGPGVVQHKVEVTDAAISIWAHVEERHIEGDLGEKDRRQSGHFAMKIIIYLKRAVAVAPPTKEFAILTNTSVCTCPPSLRLEIDRAPHEMHGAAKSIRLENKASIVRELMLPPFETPLGRPMTSETAHDWGKSLRQIVRSSMSSPDRYPRGAVDFWELDVIQDAVRSAGKRSDIGMTTVREALDGGGLQARGLTDATRTYLRSGSVASMTVAELMRPRLRELVALTGLDYADAAALRASLLTYGTQASAGQRRRRVPDLLGMHLDEARRALEIAQVKMGAVEHRDDEQPTDVVLEQSPASGTEVGEATEASLVVSTGLSVRLPNVVGLALSEACCRIRQAGLATEPALHIDDPNAQRFVVHGMTPAPGRYVTPHASVTLRVGR